MAIQKTISPVDGSVYVERELADPARVEAALESAVAAQRKWRETSLAERARLCSRMVDAFVARRDELARELTWQMGRPIAVAGGEIGGFEDRARTMIAMAEEALAPIRLADKPGFTRYITREPLGVSFIVAPWNFPFMTAVNAVVPAIMAGNAVILKHSAQTPLCAERFQQAFDEAGLPEGVFQHLHLAHDDAESVIRDVRIAHVSFTGSVAGGAMVERNAAGRFIATGLELGGKDPAYIRADVNLDEAVPGVMDGAFFNSGQSCCGIERIYVHASIFDDFVERAVAWVRQLKLGNPTDPATTLGPLVRPAAADFVRGQIEEAVAVGARAWIDPGEYPLSRPGSAYLAPQVLTEVDHSMRVMNEESFGPVVGIMPVADDDEAVRLMNDSDFGLTAAVFTRDIATGEAIARRLEAGTVFTNRCDYLDPELAWTGVKQSGRGCSLSRVGYETLTRPKSFHLKHA
ncbi:aldehyde dehydrogenase family protein [Billgrantia tianxiuensis]|uniref:Aldehyde dehydrogenase family protein n=1 Tax=Billgrantia tianxiuensis TaxID=2497861 RepID=A0A6I6SKJ6_9GAMM|nr:aldehyde dehydrogenase family protein [Halomonas tianxiuensis]MCE8033639.1 aldehyde dehydrogenase family protein [Halomonas sp. MCCC 1A11057]QHC51228.1 aldehyde dehydrogenase family protein [Halomonas tianxiuensis]